MIRADFSKRRGKSTQRAARRRFVGYELHGSRSPRQIGSRRNEYFIQLQTLQKIELNLPERFAAKNKTRLFPAHPTRLTAGEQNRADFHSSEMLAVDRNLPLVKIRARKPPRPLRNSLAPGAIARFIQSHGRLSSVP